MKIGITLFCGLLMLAFVMGCGMDDNPISSQEDPARYTCPEPWPGPEPPPEPPGIEPGDFRTETQGGWGGKGEPGQYLAANFPSAFPSGLVVGCTDMYTVTYTVSTSIKDFLPEGGSAGALDQSYVDPGKSTNTSAGGFLSQVTALALSVGFDAYDPDFGASSTALADLVVVEGPCAGLTVGEVLDEANEALGGCGSSYSISVLHTCVGMINENFVGGTMVGTYLELP